MQVSPKFRHIAHADFINQLSPNDLSLNQTHFSEGYCDLPQTMTKKVT
jgi:hypothetical protein